MVLVVMFKPHTNRSSISLGKPCSAGMRWTKFAEQGALGLPLTHTGIFDLSTNFHRLLLHAHSRVHSPPQSDMSSLMMCRRRASIFSLVPRATTLPLPRVRSDDDDVVNSHTPFPNMTCLLTHLSVRATGQNLLCDEGIPHRRASDAAVPAVRQARPLAKVHGLQSGVLL